MDEVEGHAPVNGIYHKFEVNRTDGSSKPGGKHEHCAYFVLDLEHDPFSMPALLAYADACEAVFPDLASDLRRIVWLGRAAVGCGCREANCPHVQERLGPSDIAQSMMLTRERP